MKLLLDTHTFLWWDASPTKLSKTAFAALEDDSNEIYLSLVSIWEIQIKVQLGKLASQNSLQATIEQQRKDNNIQILTLNENQIFKLDSLPFQHKDPFDRLLVAQSVYENFTFITDDPLIKQYSIAILW